MIKNIRSIERRTVVALVLVVVLVVAGGLWWWREHRAGLHVRAEFTSAVGLFAGCDVRILGVPVGTVDSVTPHGTDVTISMTLDPGISVRADTLALIVAPNLVSDRYVELTGAYASGPKLADNTMLGLSRTRTPVELDALYRSLTSLATALGPKGANSNGALNRLLQVGAANLSGNGTRLNRTIAALGASGRTLAGSRKDIFATVDQLSQFTRTLADHNSQLASANSDLASVSQTLVNDRSDFAAAIQDLGGALLLVKNFVRAHRASLTTNINRLSRVATSLGTRRTSLAAALKAAPLLLENFLNAYDPQHKLLRGRTDLNELTVWARQNATTTAATRSVDTASDTGADTPANTSSSTPPPALLPGVTASTDGP
jgi:phospholipid/cholesterol/gamma-HCH transport system substrate-binding protein